MVLYCPKCGKEHKTADRNCQYCGADLKNIILKFKQKNLPRFVIEPVMALTFHLFVLATAIPDSDTQAAGTALVLLVLVMIMYGFAIYVRNHYQKKINW